VSTDASKSAGSDLTKRKRLILLVSMALLIVAPMSAVAYLWPRPVSSAEAGKGTGGAELAESSGSFTIKGDAAELISPGVMAPLDLLLTNPQGVPMLVTDLSVTVRGVSAPNADGAHPCVVGDFTVDQASRSLEITLPAGATSAFSSLGVARASPPAVGMLERSVNRDGCKGASLTLGYAASGTVSQ
jgi:hypothetical protein